MKKRIIKMKNTYKKYKTSFCIKNSLNYCTKINENLQKKMMHFPKICDIIKKQKTGNRMLCTTM